MKAFVHPPAAELSLVQVLYAVADPVRLNIIIQLSHGGELTCNEFKVAAKHKSTMTHHFKVLRESGLTFTRVAGREHYVSLRRKDLDKRFPGLLDSILKNASDG